jgi:hypothetical protein
MGVKVMSLRKDDGVCVWTAREKIVKITDSIASKSKMAFGNGVVFAAQSSDNQACIMHMNESIVSNLPCSNNLTR